MGQSDLKGYDEATAQQAERVKELEKVISDVMAYELTPIEIYNTLKNALNKSK